MTSSQNATNATTHDGASGIVMLSFDFAQFGGYKRTSDQDIVEAGGVVPDSDVLTKGGKRIFPRERLTSFGTLKTSIVRELWKFSVKTLGGSVMAFHERHLAEAEKILNDGELEYNKLIAELDQFYEPWLDAYIAENPKDGNIIRRSALTKADALSRFRYGYEAFKPAPVGLNGSIESMASKLTARLYKEVAQAAYDLWDKSYNPIVDKSVSDARRRRKVGQKALSPIKACRDKLTKLSFLNPSVNGAIVIIQQVLATMPPTGYIEDTPSNPADKRLYALVTLMMDSAALLNAAESVVNGADVDTVLKLSPLQHLPQQASLPGAFHEQNPTAENIAQGETETTSEVSLPASTPVVAAEGIAQTQVGASIDDILAQVTAPAPVIVVGPALAPAVAPVVNNTPAPVVPASVPLSKSPVLADAGSSDSLEMLFF